MVASRVCAAFSIRCNLNALSTAIPDVRNSISASPIGSASIQKNQIAKPPRIDPRLLPDPPTITITQIRNVNLSGWYEAGVKTPILVPSSASGGQFKAFEEMFALFGEG